MKHDDNELFYNQMSDIIDNFEANTLRSRGVSDKACRSKAIARWLHRDKKIRIISIPKSNEVNPTPVGQRDIAMHKHRIYIEHYFGMMKRLKRIRNRFDKHLSMYLTFWYLAMARTTFRKLQAKMWDSLNTRS